MFNSVMFLFVFSLKEMFMKVISRLWDSSWLIEANSEKILFLNITYTYTLLIIDEYEMELVLFN